MKAAEVRGAPPSLPVYANGTRNLVAAAARVAGRRSILGPRRPGWSYLYEVATEMLRGVGDEHAMDPRAHESLHDIRKIFHTVELQRTFARARARFHRERIAGVPGTWIRPRRVRTERFVYYVHGGGYFFGSSATHGAFLAELAYAARAEIFAVDYCLAPEHRFPRAHDEVYAAYRALLTGRDPARTIIGGDSAGGGLSVATMLRARDACDPLPRLAILLSPWIDLATPIAKERDQADWLPPELLPMAAEAYLGDVDTRHPHVSPIHADLAGLAPMVIHAGGAEIFRDQIERFTGVARAAGVDVTLDIEPHMVHVWHAFAPIVREGRSAIAKLAASILAHVPS